jgi:hypothetical protein
MPMENPIAERKKPSFEENRSRSAILTFPPARAYSPYTSRSTAR